MTPEKAFRVDKIERLMTSFLNDHNEKTRQTLKSEVAWLIGQVKSADKLSNSQVSIERLATAEIELAKSKEEKNRLEDIIRSHQNILDSIVTLLGVSGYSAIMPELKVQLSQIDQDQDDVDDFYKEYPDDDDDNDLSGIAEC